MFKKILHRFKNLNVLIKNMVTTWLLLMFSFFFSIFYRYNASFPTPIQVLTGLVDVWNDGLIMHLFNSLSLCFQAIFYSIIISMVFAYLTNIIY
jgi:NitT/TauT family transport system permease protein